MRRKSAQLGAIQLADAGPNAEGHSEHGEAPVQALVLAQQQGRLVGVVIVDHDGKFHLLLQVFEVDDGHAAVEILLDIALVTPSLLIIIVIIIIGARFFFDLAIGK